MEILNPVHMNANVLRFDGVRRVPEFANAHLFTGEGHATAYEKYIESKERGWL